MNIGNPLENMVEHAIGKVMEAIPRIFDSLFAILSTIIYGLISIFFDVLTAIPKIDLLQKIEMEDIYQRCTMIITIVMAFYITFEVVKYVVQPDSITDKSKGAGNIVLRMIVVIILIAFVPKIFSLAYDLQARIVDSQVISKIILGKGNEGSNSLGSDFAANTFGVFYHLNTDVCNEDTKWPYSTTCEDAKDTVEQNLNMIRSGSLTGAFAFLTKNNINTIMIMRDLDLLGPTTKTYDSFEAHQPMITFNGFLAVAVGIYIAWTLIVYGTEVARRYFQLIFLQITAPIAIMSYVSPKKDGAFSKWLRQCITTYLDLFIRLAILNFIVLIINILHESFFSGGSLVQSLLKDWEITGNLAVLGWVYLLLVIGLLQFIKKAPKLLKELLPSGNAASGEFGMSGKETIGTVKGIVTGTSRTIGGFAGGIVGAKTALKSEHLKGGDKIWSTMKATFNGAKTGFSKGGNMKKATAAGRTSAQRDEDIVISSGTVIGHDFRGGHFQEKLKESDRKIAGYDEVIKNKSAVTSAAKETKVMKSVDGYITQWQHRNIGDAATQTKALKDIEKATRIYAASDRTGPGAAATIANYKTSIEAAVKSVYDNARSNAKNDFDSKKDAAQTELSQANTDNIAAINKINYYNSKTTPLTTAEEADRQNAIKTKNETDKKIEAAKAMLDQIEIDRKAEEDTLNKEEAKVVSDIQSVIGKDESVVNQVESQLENAYVVASDVSDGKYKDPVTGNLIEVRNLTKAQFAEVIGDIADIAGDEKVKEETSQARKEAKANANDSGNK